MKKIKIVISGAAETEHCNEKAVDLAYEIGKELAKNNVILLTGATTGIPLWCAKGAYENGGFVIGFSPANNEKEHKEVFQLPTDYHHIIFYIGGGHTYRNYVLIKSGDGTIFICGRTGTLNEFVIAFEENKIMGVLKETGGEEKYMEKIVDEAHKEGRTIIWEKDPVKLVSKIIEVINAKEN